MDYGNFSGDSDTRRASESLRRQRAIAQMKRKRRRKLMIRRTLIVVVGLLIIFLAIFLLVQLFKAIFGGGLGNQAVQATVAATSQTAETQAATQAQASATTFNKPTIPDDGTSEGYYSASNAGIYIYKNMALELFGSPESTAQYYADTISGFKEAAPEYTVYNMVVPNHSEFAIPQRLIDNESVYVGSQAENINYIYTHYKADVKPINCYNKLGEHINEYIYFNTDHHWTGLGAYYAYQAFCEQTNQTPLQLSDCTENKKEGFHGTFYDTASDLNPDTVYYWTFPYKTHAMRQEESGMDLYEMELYYEYIEDSGSLYSTFICGDSSLFIEYNDDNKNGKKIAVVKESYGNAFAPYLTYNYEEVHVIDSRYFSGSLKDYMTENGINEVIFVNNTMSSNNPFMVDGIRAIY